MSACLPASESARRAMSESTCELNIESRSSCDMAEFGVAAGFLAGGPAARARRSLRVRAASELRPRLPEGICRNGIVGAGAVRGGCGEHAPGCGRAEHQLGEEQDQPPKTDILP